MLQALPYLDRCIALRLHSHVAFKRFDGPLRLRAVDAVDWPRLVSQRLQISLDLLCQLLAVGRRVFATRALGLCALRIVASGGLSWGCLLRV